MSELFARYLEAGIFGSVIILVILLLRLLLRKAPRRILCLLWLLAALRLLLPFQIESRLSLQPNFGKSSEVVVQQSPIDLPPTANTPILDDQVTAPAVSTDNLITDSVTVTPDVSKVSIEPLMLISIIWAALAGAAVVYLLVSYMILKLRVREAVKSEDGVLECDRIRGAFLLGYFRPKIYLPMRVTSRDRGFIIAHERAHIARCDNWWKLMGFVCAALHWYNPLVWLSYVLLCRDIELACDEKVIRPLDLSERKAYSMALLNCGKSLAGVSVCPVAFGEVSLKTRIKRVLRYRKPGVWITVVALALVMAVAVCFLTSPMAEAMPPEESPEETQEQAREQTEEPTQPSTEFPTVPPETEPIPETTEHIHAYTVQTVAPTCIEEGYDLHICTCGDQYTDNSVEKVKHEYYWVEVRYEENRMRAQCANCPAEFWETVPLNYNDTGSVRQRLESYAAAYGFDLNFVGSKSDAICFSHLVKETYFDDDELVAMGKTLITEAYEYCLDNNLNISKQMCYIDISGSPGGSGGSVLFGGSSNNFSNGSQPGPILWDYSVIRPNNQTSSTGYSSGQSTSGKSSATWNSGVSVYILSIPEETPNEMKENDSVSGDDEVLENTESTESTTEPTGTSEPAEDVNQEVPTRENQAEHSDSSAETP